MGGSAQRQQRHFMYKSVALIMCRDIRRHGHALRTKVLRRDIKRHGHALRCRRCSTSTTSRLCPRRDKCQVEGRRWLPTAPSHCKSACVCVCVCLCEHERALQITTSASSRVSKMRENTIQLERVCNAHVHTHRCATLPTTSIRQSSVECQPTGKNQRM
jgi:hypothetical protein